MLAPEKLLGWNLKIDRRFMPPKYQALPVVGGWFGLWSGNYETFLSLKPDVILYETILDEPTSHLDVSNQLTVLSTIERLSADGVSVIMTSHFPDHAFLLRERIAVMQNGRFAASGSGRGSHQLPESFLRPTGSISASAMWKRLAGGPSIPSLH